MTRMRGNVRRRAMGRREAKEILEHRRIEREERIAAQAAAMLAERAERARLRAEEAPVADDEEI